MVRVTGYDWLLIALGIVSLSLMALVLAGQFSLLTVLALSLTALAALCGVLERRGVESELGSPDLWLIAILAIGLLLRSNFSTNYIAGNDSGLYVAFSGIIEHFGGMYAPDNFRLTLPADLLTLYDRGKMPGMLGIGSKFYAVFYPLHPGWMAIFSSLFGPDAHCLSVVMFSLLGVTGAYYLTLVLSDDIQAARLAALFMAVNPALCYLGKLPFTEAQAAALLLNASYLLVRALREQGFRMLLLGTSLLLFTAYFFTRLNFPVTVLPWAALYLLSHSGRLSKDTALRLRGFLCCFVAAMVLSLIIYWIALPYLFKSIVIDIYVDLLRRHPPLVVLIAMAMVGILAFELSPLTRLRLNSLLSLLVNWSERSAAWLPVISLIISALTIGALTKNGTSFYGNEVPPAFDNFRLHVVYRLAQVLTPFLFVPLILLPRVRRRSAVAIPCLFFALCLVLTVIFTPALPYLWYHARYLSSEIVPFAIVIISVVLAPMMRRSSWASMLITAPALGMMIVLSAIELYSKEAEAPSLFHELDNAIGASDVVIASAREIDARFPVPLRYYFNKQIFLLPSDAAAQDGERVVNYLLEQSGKTVGRVFILSRGLGTIKAPHALERVVRYHEARLLAPDKDVRKFLPPLRWYFNDIDFRLDRVKARDE